MLRNQKDIFVKVLWRNELVTLEVEGEMMSMYSHLFRSTSILFLGIKFLTVHSSDLRFLVTLMISYARVFMKNIILML